VGGEAKHPFGAVGGAVTGQYVRAKGTKEIGLVVATVLASDGRVRARVHFQRGHKDWGAYETYFDAEELTMVKVKWRIS
jgi:hypothetical protein